MLIQAFLDLSWSCDDDENWPEMSVSANKFMINFTSQQFPPIQYKSNNSISNELDVSRPTQLRKAANNLPSLAHFIE